MITLGISVVSFYSGQVLMVKRCDFPVWALPGGRMNDGETPFDTAKREVLEETGLEIHDMSLVSVYSKPKWFDGGDITILIKAGLSKVKGLRPDMVECSDVKLFDTENLPKQTTPWHMEYISDSKGENPAKIRIQDYEWPFSKNLSWKECVELTRADKMDLRQFEGKLRT